MTVISRNPYGSDPVRLSPLKNLVGVAWGGKFTWLCIQCDVTYDPDAGALDPGTFQPFTVKITDIITTGGSAVGTPSDLGFPVPLDFCGVDDGTVTGVSTSYTSNPTYPENADPTLFPLNRAQTTVDFLQWYLGAALTHVYSATQHRNYAGVMFNIDYLRVLGIETLTIKGEVAGLSGTTNFFADICQATAAELGAASDATEYYAFAYPLTTYTVSHYFEEAIGSFSSPYGSSLTWQLDMDLTTRKFTGNGGLGDSGLFSHKYINDFASFVTIDT